MPESRARKKAADHTPPPARSAPTPSPRWYAPLMVALFVIGLVYIVTFYITQQEYPVPSLGRANILVGFGIIMAGFGMATRWR
ncbi:MAG TPA: cell division protein CrgA [Actinomycetales bacterium]